MTIQPNDQQAILPSIQSNNQDQSRLREMHQGQNLNGAEASVPAKPQEQEQMSDAALDDPNGDQLHKQVFSHAQKEKAGDDIIEKEKDILADKDAQPSGSQTQMEVQKVQIVFQSQKSQRDSGCNNVSQAFCSENALQQKLETPKKTKKKCPEKCKVAFEEDKSVQQMPSQPSQGVDLSGLKVKKSQSVAQCSNSKQLKGLNGNYRMGRWTKDEHFRFLEALKLFGKEWKKVQEHVGTRTSTQARSHAQKFFNKLEKRHQKLEDFLRTLDLDNLENHYIMSDLEDEGVQRTESMHISTKKSKTKDEKCEDSPAEIGQVADCTEQNQDQDNNVQSITDKLQLLDKNAKAQFLDKLPRSQRKRKGGAIDYALFDRTGCQTQSKSSTEQNEDNSDHYVNQKHPASANKHNDENSKQSLLGKRVKKHFAEDNEFQKPLPKASTPALKGVENLKQVGPDSVPADQTFQIVKVPSDQAHLKYQKIMDQCNQAQAGNYQIITPNTQTSLNSQQAGVQVINDRIVPIRNPINQLANPGALMMQHRAASTPLGYPYSAGLVNPQMAANQFVQNAHTAGANISAAGQQQPPMTPNLKHSLSVCNNIAISMVDHDSHFSLISHYSGSGPNKQAKKQRANSYDFGKGILDKEDEAEEDLNLNQQLIGHATVNFKQLAAQNLTTTLERMASVPPGPAPPHSLRLDPRTRGMTLDGDQLANNRQMITPKQEYTVFDLLPPDAQQQNNMDFGVLERMRSNFHMRKNSDHDADPNCFRTGEISDNTNRIQMHGNILPIPDLQQRNILQVAANDAQFQNMYGPVAHNFNGITTALIGQNGVIGAMMPQLGHNNNIPQFISVPICSLPNPGQVLMSLPGLPPSQVSLSHGALGQVNLAANVGRNFNPNFLVQPDGANEANIQGGILSAQANRSAANEVKQHTSTVVYQQGPNPENLSSIQEERKNSLLQEECE